MSETIATQRGNAEEKLVTLEVRARIQAVALREDDGSYSASVPALPGCVTQGDNLDEVLANVVEAAEGWLAVAHERAKDQAVREMLP